ncbi:hypothetical protein ACC755_37720, partial [Rhizobium ruizarguesonis]
IARQVDLVDREHELLDSEQRGDRRVTARLLENAEARFEKISHDFREFALSLGVKQITAIQMSALKGENVVYSGQAAMPW